jgi:ribonuclease P protein component
MSGLARLKRRAEFLRVAGGRRKWVTPGLILQTLRRPAEGAPVDRAGEPRIGFTASRKVGIAVARNRARRRLRAAADQVMPRHAAAGHDYVLIARGETLTRAYAALVNDLETALRRLGVYCDDPVPAAPVDRPAAKARAGETPAGERQAMAATTGGSC